MGEQEATPVMHAAISSPTSALLCGLAASGGELCLSNFRDNTTNPSTQLRIDSEVIESVFFSESTRASDDGTRLNLSEH